MLDKFQKLLNFIINIFNFLVSFVKILLVSNYQVFARKKIQDFIDDYYFLFL